METIQFIQVTPEQLQTAIIVCYQFELIASMFCLVLFIQVYFRTIQYTIGWSNSLYKNINPAWRDWNEVVFITPRTYWKK